MTAAKLKFVIFSLLGIAVFFVSYDFRGAHSITVDHVAALLRLLAGPVAPYAALLLIVYGAARPFILRTWRRSLSELAFTAFKLLGVVCAVMFMTKLGPEVIHRPGNLPFLYNKLAVFLTFLIPIGAVCLVFLTAFGLMEFVGRLARPIMRRAFQVPGRAAIDAVGSFVGSYAIALLITDDQYRARHYNTREAVIIATGFSTVSAPFVLVVANTLNLMEHWNAFFWTTMLTTFLVTAITVRLWPLRSIDQGYFTGVDLKRPAADLGAAAAEKEAAAELSAAVNSAAAGTAVTKSPRRSAFVQAWIEAWDEAVAQAARSQNVFKLMGKTFISGINITSNFVPMILSIGLTGLLLAQFTPVFKFIGYLFFPFAWIVGAADPLAVSQALSSSLAEMYLPAILSKDFALPDRYLVGVASISVILFFSAIIPCIKGTSIPVSMRHLLAIWFVRMILSILVAGAFAKLLF